MAKVSGLFHLVTRYDVVDVAVCCFVAPRDELVEFVLDSGRARFDHVQKREEAANGRAAVCSRPAKSERF
jgi:hypothetical protein